MAKKKDNLKQIGNASEKIRDLIDEYYEKLKPLNLSEDLVDEFLFENFCFVIVMLHAKLLPEQADEDFLDEFKYVFGGKLASARKYLNEMINESHTQNPKDMA